MFFRIWRRYIVQISAVHGGRQFNKYILPRKQISIAASEVTKIEKQSKNLYYDGQVVEADNLEHAMSGNQINLFFCTQRKQLWFKNFDSNFKVYDPFERKDCRILDTLPYFRQKYPELHNHNQNNLSRILLSKDYSCDAHNALNDVHVLVLQKLILYENISLELFLKFSFPVSYEEDGLRYFHGKKQCLVTLSQLSNVTSKSMLKKIAGSRLALMILHELSNPGGLMEWHCYSRKRERTENQGLLTKLKYWKRSARKYIYYLLIKTFIQDINILSFYFFLIHANVMISPQLRIKCE